ncbi:MAG: hypothetical protein KC502_07580 [Myxococcales bacterium]|nr:hypothetical protein [Myxococcales bacterium]
MALVMAAYFYPYPYHPPINNPNENSRFYMTSAIVEEGTYCIDGPRKRWGWVNDAARYKGKHFSVKGPATSLLGLPGYAIAWAWAGIQGQRTDRDVALWWCRLTGSLLPNLLFLWFFLPWLGRRTGSALLRDATWLTVAVGSLFYGYALIFVSHSLAAASGFAALMLLSKTAGSAPKARKDAFWAGFFAAGVTAAEYPGIVITLALCGLALTRLGTFKQLARFAAGAIIPTAAVMHMQWMSFDNPFTPGHLHMESAAFRAYHERGLFGADAFHADAAFQLLFSEGFGLFPLSPLLLFALPGLALLLMRRVDRSVGIAAVVASVGLWLECAFLSNWRGGWTIGPRYLAPLIPFVAWAALTAMDALWRMRPRLTEAIAVGAMAVGMLASGLPSAWYPHLPEDFDRPLPQLFFRLLDGAFVPETAASLLGIHGLAAAFPLLLVAIGIVWVVASTNSWPELPMPTSRKLLMAGPLWTRRLGGGALVAAVLVVPLLQDPTAAKRRIPLDRARAFVMSHWSPRGHDRAAKLLANGERTPEQTDALSRLLIDQGRRREVRALLPKLPAERQSEIRAELSGK